MAGRAQRPAGAHTAREWDQPEWYVCACSPRVVARKPKVGAPKELLRASERPTAEEIDAAVEGRPAASGPVGFISDLLGT
eukprot:6231811-Prymnesium_polylepis.1